MWEWHALGHIPVERIPQPRAEGQLPVGLRARQLDRPRHERRRAALGPQHLGACTTSTSTAARPLAPRRQRTAASSSARACSFYWQHDAAFQPGGLISLFDNGSDPPKEKQSRGLLLAPNFGPQGHAWCKQFVNPSRTLLASSQGNTLSLPGGNWLLGYGGLPNFTEFDGSGHVLLDGTLGRSVQSFRTYLSPWSATAPGAPSVGRGARGRRPDACR